MTIKKKAKETDQSLEDHWECLRKLGARENPRLSTRILWLGPESNQRHMDFQSTALPTELPSLDLTGKISSLSRRKATA